MNKGFFHLSTAIFIGLFIYGCKYEKAKTYVYVDSLFIKDSMKVFSCSNIPGTLRDNYKDTSRKHFELEYLTEVNEQIQLNKVKFLVPIEKYDTLDKYLRSLPVLAMTGRQFRNEQTRENMPGDFVGGKFIDSHTSAVIIPFGEYMKHSDDKYKYEVIDTMPKGYVSVGITKSMIRKALGEPVNVITSDTQTGCLEQWTYEIVYKFDGTTEKLKDLKIIYFINEKAVSIKG